MWAYEALLQQISKEKLPHRSLAGWLKEPILNHLEWDDCCFQPWTQICCSHAILPAPPACPPITQRSPNQSHMPHACLDANQTYNQSTQWNRLWFTLAVWAVRHIWLRKTEFVLYRWAKEKPLDSDREKMLKLNSKTEFKKEKKKKKELVTAGPLTFCVRCHKNLNGGLLWSHMWNPVWRVVPGAVKRRIIKTRCTLPDTAATRGKICAAKGRKTSPLAELGWAC